MAHNASQTVVWNPADYAANSSSQYAWAREQIARLDLKGHERILDVGCGDGRITAELAAQVPQGAVVGVDSSTTMIGYALAAFPLEAHRNLEFRVMDARHLQFSQPLDLVFSNAALHWVDDHQAFLRGAADCLRSGGRLLVSCGGKGNAQEVFAVLRGKMRLKRWRPYFRKVEAPYFFHRPEEYEKWLPRHGFRPLRVCLAEKDAQFTREGLAAWLRTTWLPYTQRVPEAEREDFVADIVDRYLVRHPLDPTGRMHVRMIRLEIDAQRF